MGASLGMATSQPAMSAAVLAQLADVLRSMRYGTVQITVHDSRVVQIEKVERMRLMPSLDRAVGEAE